MKRKSIKKGDSLNRLLTEAAKCFSEKGFEGTTIAEIADKAEMSQGNIYVHFPSKIELFRSIIANEYAHAARRITETLNDDISMQSVISELFKCVRNKKFPMDHRLWLEIMAVAARDKDIRKTFLESDKLLHDSFVALLRRAAELGIICGSDDFDRVTEWVFALIDGMVARIADGAIIDIERQVEFSEHIVKMVFEGRIER